MKRKIIILISVILVLNLIYFLGIRKSFLFKGEDTFDFKNEMPGDNFVEDPLILGYNAVFIKAPIDIVWQFIIQMGHNRAGWYGNDALNKMYDSDYFYEGYSSANNIINELQTINVGDSIVFDKKFNFTITRFKKNEYLLLTTENKIGIDYVWVFYLESIDDNNTLLVMKMQKENSGDIFNKIGLHYFTEPYYIGIHQNSIIKGIKKKTELYFKINY